MQCAMIILFKTQMRDVQLVWFDKTSGDAKVILTQHIMSEQQTAHGHDDASLLCTQTAAVARPHT